jgi:hypothetical protein
VLVTVQLRLCNSLWPEGRRPPWLVLPPEQAGGTGDERENAAIPGKDSKDPIGPKKRQFVYNRVGNIPVTKYF